MHMSTVIRPENILLGLAAPTKLRLLHILASKAAERLDLSAEVIFKALEHRENLGSTGIGDGIAVPHATVPGLSKVITLMGRLDRPLEFEAIDGEPVDLVFLVLIPGQGNSDYLKMLASIARTMRADGMLDVVRKARSADEIYIALTSETVGIPPG